MRSRISFAGYALLIFVSVSAFQECICQFKCPQHPKNLGDGLPNLPQTYSTNIKVNYLLEMKTVKLREVVNRNEQKMSMEFWQKDRHVKYIQHGAEKQLLIIKYDGDDIPTCTVKELQSANSEYFETEDAGPSGMLEKLISVVNGEKRSLFIDTNAHLVENNVIVSKYVNCFTDPVINASVSLAAINWGQPFFTVLDKGVWYIESIDAQMGNEWLTALFSDFNPVMPDDAEFQPPENLYCEGFRHTKKLPDMPNFFSYDSEILVYESSAGIAPIATHRRVFYDFQDNIARADFYDSLAENQDLFSTVTAQEISIIHDFKSGVQYKIDLETGNCEIDEFKVTFGPARVRQSDTMPNGTQFFSLPADKISYNGEYPTRGYTADVFTAPVETVDEDGKKVRYIYTWYFASDLTQVVETDHVEKNVLLRMVIRPEAAEDKEGEIDINFYDYNREQPGAFEYDIRDCYHGSDSVTYLLTFPVDKRLLNSKKLIQAHIHDQIKAITGISKQRIFVSSLTFNDKYMFVEITMLQIPHFSGSKKVDESTLDEAVEKLKQYISDEKFNSKFTVDDMTINLRPEPFGFTLVKKDPIIQANNTYKEGSVIGLTIGMLALGILLGAMIVNLVMSKKFGVSLFQKSRNGANAQPFHHDESAI